MNALKAPEGAHGQRPSAMMGLVMTVRATRKLLDRLGPAITDLEQATTLLGEWYGTALPWRPPPGLRLAAWRAIWGTLRNNPVHAARYRHLTTREQNPLKPTQAQAAVAAALLRQLHAIVTTGQAWDPVIATRGTRPAPVEAPLAA